MITKRGLTFKSFDSWSKQTGWGSVTALVPVIPRSWGLVKKHGVWYKQEGFKVIWLKESKSYQDR